MNEYDVLAATGLDPAECEVQTRADPINDLPGLMVVCYTGQHRAEPSAIATVRAWPRDVDEQGHVGRWEAVACISVNPVMPINDFTPEEQERLRAETQIPLGMSKPVGQEAVIGKSDPKPYTPPVPALEAPDPNQAKGGGWVAEATEDPYDDTEASDIQAEPLSCHVGCVRMTGPEGTMDSHDPECPLAPQKEDEDA